MFSREVHWTLYCKMVEIPQKLQESNSGITKIRRPLRGRPFDSEGGGGGGWHFLEINILTLKILEINNLSYSGKKINNLT